MTSLPTGEGWLYRAVVLDLCSRAVVGWSMAHHRRAELVHQALSMALSQRQPAAGLLRHTEAAPAPVRDRALYEPQGPLLGQRGGREFLPHLKNRSDLSRGL